jgi:hypothetical protein
LQTLNIKIKLFKRSYIMGIAETREDLETRIAERNARVKEADRVRSIGHKIITELEQVNEGRWPKLGKVSSGRWRDTYYTFQETPIVENVPEFGSLALRYTRADDAGAKGFSIMQLLLVTSNEASYPYATICSKDEKAPTDLIVYETGVHEPESLEADNLEVLAGFKAVRVGLQEVIAQAPPIEPRKPIMGCPLG